jgi:hypothetical protein
MQNATSMRLYTSIWKEQETFKMLPVSKDSPFLEVIYDTELKQLAVVGAHLKKGFTYMDKLDNNGHKTKISGYEGLKKQYPTADIYPYKRERVEIDVVNEYYIKEESEQVEFIKRFAENAEGFSFQKYIDAPATTTATVDMTPKLEVVASEEGAAAAAASAGDEKK